MIYDGLPLDELVSLSITDQGARAFIAENAEEIIAKASDYADTDAYDEGYEAGRQHDREGAVEYLIDIIDGEHWRESVDEETRDWIKVDLQTYLDDDGTA